MLCEATHTKNGGDTEILMHVVIIYNLAVRHYFWDRYTQSAAIVLLAAVRMLS